MCVVTRYFGGILLGAGGLVRAYSAAASGAISEAPKASYQKCVEFLISVQYPQYDKLSRLMQNNGIRITDTLYGEQISITGIIPENKYENFKNEVINVFGARVDTVFLKNTIQKI